jgi:replication factor A1
MQGIRIHCSVKKTLIYRFQKQLSEGVVYTIATFDVVESTSEYSPTSQKYKLEETYNTKFTRIYSIVFQEIVHSFTPPVNVFKNDFNRDFLIGLFL